MGHLGVGSIGDAQLLDGDGSPEGFGLADLGEQCLGDGQQLSIGHSHVTGAAHVGSQLGLDTLQTSQGTYRDEFTVGMGEVVAGEDVAKQVGLEVIVLGRAEGVVKGLPRELCLHFGALFQGVVIAGQGSGVFTLDSGLAVGFALFQHLLECA